MTNTNTPLVTDEAVLKAKVAIPEIYTLVKTACFSTDEWGRIDALRTLLVRYHLMAETLKADAATATVTPDDTREFLAEKAQVIAEHMYDVMKDENASIELRRRAAEFIAEAAFLKPKAEAKATVTPANTPAKAKAKRVNCSTGEGVAEAEEKALTVLLNLYRNDIALFAKEVFGAKLTPEQITFCEEFRTERTITRYEPPAWGKTYVAAIAVWWSLVCFDDVRVTIFAPSEVGIRCGIWRELQALHARMAEPFKDLFYVGAVRISRKSDARGCFAEMRLAGDDIASARGIHAVNNFVFVDEADGVPEEVIANLHGIFNDRNPKLCLLSTDMSEFTKAKAETVAPSQVAPIIRALRLHAKARGFKSREDVSGRTLQAVEFMFDLMKDETAPVKQRMRAAMWLAEASKPLLTKKLSGAGKSE